MKNISDMTVKELKALPEYPWTGSDNLEVKCLYFMKNGKKHDSGFACISSFAEVQGKPYLLGDYHDALDIKGCRIDVIFKNGLFRFFPTSIKNPKLIVRYRLSDFCAECIKR